MLLQCDTCTALPSPETGRFLCLEPVRHEPTRQHLVCKACVEFREVLRQQAIALEQDNQLWADHLEECTPCHRNKGLIPRGLLFQACVKRRREAREREAVAQC